jgi:hypothetical protein
MCAEIGVDRMMIGTDFPHVEGTWPNTIDWLRSTFAGVPEDDARLVLGQNAIKLYGLDAAQLQKVAARIGLRADELLNQDVQIDPRLLDHFEARSGFAKEPTFDDEFVNRCLDEDWRRISAVAIR